LAESGDDIRTVQDRVNIAASKYKTNVTVIKTETVRKCCIYTQRVNIMLDKEVT